MICLWMTVVACRCDEQLGLGKARSSDRMKFANSASKYAHAPLAGCDRGRSVDSEGYGRLRGVDAACAWFVVIPVVRVEPNRSDNRLSGRGEDPGLAGDDYSRFRLSRPASGRIRASAHGVAQDLAEAGHHGAGALAQGERFSDAGVVFRRCVRCFMTCSVIPQE